MRGELDQDAGVSQVRCHREISNRGNHSDGCSDVVEHSVAAGDSEAHSDEDDCRQNHDGSDSPIPVGAMNSDSNVSTHSWVDVQSIVSSAEEAHLDQRVMIIPRNG